MNELVSIIIPVFNVEKYISMCIQSVLLQTYKELQILLIDDGSFDMSGKICDKYAEIDPRIKVIHKKNEGVSVARNVGIEYAIGKYICFVDSDDYLTKMYVAELVSAIKNNNVEMAMCGHFRLQNGKLFPQGFENRILSKEDKKFYWYMCINLKGRFLWNKIYLTELIKENGIFFEKGIHPGEDTLFNLKYSFCVKKVKIIDTPLYVYVDSISSVMKRDLSRSCFENYKRQIKPHEKLMENNLSEKEKNCVQMRIFEICANLIYDNKKYGLHRNVKEYKKFVNDNVWRYLSAPYISRYMKGRNIFLMIWPQFFDIVRINCTPCQGHF